MLLDDERVPYCVGECLVHLPREDVEERLQAGEAAPRIAAYTRPQQAGRRSVVAWTPSQGCRRAGVALLAPRCSGGHASAGRSPHGPSLLPPAAPAALDAAQADAARLQAEMAGVRGQMAELKAVLYAKFGSSVGALICTD